MRRDKFHFILLLLIAAVLFLGTREFRLRKANFLGNTLFLPFIESVHEIKNIIEARKENKILREKLSESIILRNKLQNELSQLKNTDVELPDPDYDFVIANVIGFTGKFNEKNIIIDKGKLEGLKRELPVISKKGIIGKIISTGLNTSIVLPYKDLNFNLSVMDKKSRVQGILTTDYFENVYMDMVKKGSDISVGDTVITSNLSSVFPQGYPVGIIEKLVMDVESVHIKARIKAFSDLSTIEHVIVLIPREDTNDNSN